MTLKTKTTALAIAHLAPLALLAGMASAQDAAVDPAVDVNGDGMYSFVEISNIYPEFMVETFTGLDVNGDGLLDLDEIVAGTDADLMPKPTE